METEKVNPQFPIYIVSKGRHESRLTAKYLDSINVPYKVVVEQQEFDLYAQHIPADHLLVLNIKYKNEYDTCDAMGDSKGKGPGPARNFAWDHAIHSGYEWHWVMDDNIRTFRRFNKNEKVKISNGGIFRAMEDFCLRYTNIWMAGPNCYMFVPSRHKRPPFTLNNRIYSCNLIKNDIPFRWRGRYNEDTDLSLRILKAGYCTVQFNAFLQEKMPTQTIKGGNTDMFYAREGTYNKSKMQVALHPDVSRMVQRFGRIHHHVDYSGFRQTLKRDPARWTEQEMRNEYGMALKQAQRNDSTR